MHNDFVVQSSRGSYPVRFARGAVAAFDVGAREWAVVDARLTTPASTRVLRVTAGEALKSLGSVEHLVTELLARGFKRGDTLSAVGGGTVQDVVGFIAGTLMRGTPWRIVPTTLLAQADACIGGKTAVNVGGMKNALGTVTAPTEVVVDSAVLKTLPAQAVRSGLGEVLKAHALISRSAWDAVAADLDVLDTAPVDDTRLQPLIVASLLLKRDLVMRDEFDAGCRRLLNFGHTFGHALEAVVDYAVPHGICVAWGMQVANRVAVARGLLSDADRARMQPALARLADTVAAVKPAQILARMQHDKKRTGAHHTLVLLAGDDARACVVDVDDEAALSAAIAQPW